MWMNVAGLAAVIVAASFQAAEAAPTLKGPNLSELKGGGLVGLGVVGGTTNGVSVKVWPTRSHGFVLHIGAPPVLNSLGVHLSYRLHTPPIVAPGGPAVLFQLGPAFRTRMVFQNTGVFAELGGGIVAGMSVTVPQWPVEFFAEVQPTFAGSVSVPGTGLGLSVEGVGGVRIYFGGAKAAPEEATSWAPTEAKMLSPEDPDAEPAIDEDGPDGETPGEETPGEEPPGEEPSGEETP